MASAPTRWSSEAFSVFGTSRHGRSGRSCSLLGATQIENPRSVSGGIDLALLDGGALPKNGACTHAALWSVLALAKLGDGDTATRLFSLLNPINHARTRADVHRYKVEPYVVSADIYAVAPHVGRGGWTWYTGSAGWMQRAGIEGILGLRIRGMSLHLDPCIPNTWPGFGIVFRYRSACYEIQVENPRGVSRGIQLAILDGETLPKTKAGIPLTDDGATHQIRIVLG